MSAAGVLDAVTARLDAAYKMVCGILSGDGGLAGRASSVTLVALADQIAVSMMSPSESYQFGRQNERGDVVAYLRQRHRAATSVALHNPEESDRAREIARQIAIEIEAIEQSLHEYAASTAEQIGKGGNNG